MPILEDGSFLLDDSGLEPYKVKTLEELQEEYRDIIVIRERE